ncbi:hypothetical protein [Butyrivibrio sp. VCD2006]|uniref:hypothetical protein n=1 Tax=Butyrivibrio sp. VCD2006 TaxID=1280664 RepID=UPI000415A58C|nr:hypothetical protein [Butyrivibrio sp. VCD2006]
MKQQVATNKENVSYGSSPYDDVFRTLVIEHKDLVLRLINEMFPGIHYEGDEEVKPLNDTYFVNQGGGEQDKKITDSAIEITGHDGVRRLFHLECQSTSDGSMIIRMFEYDVQIAIKASSDFSTDHLSVNLPESGILYLRSTSSTPDFMTVTVNVPGEKHVNYQVPILKLKNYKCDDILDRELYFLIPFYLFNFEAEFDKIEAGNQDFIDSFNIRYREIYEQLRERYEAGKISARTYSKIIEMSKKVIMALASNKKVVREEAEKIMGGQVLETETETVYREGLNEGREEGISEGLKEGRKEGRTEGIKEIDALYSWLKAQNRNDDILRAIGNETLQNELLEEYQKNKM